MKRNPKPFSVEIKKSRVQGQRDHLPPKRLFETAPVDAAKIARLDESRVVAEPAAPRRILPSIVEPMWSNVEAAEPMRRKRSSRSKATPGPIEPNLKAVAAEKRKDAPAETPMIPECMSQTDIAQAREEAVAPAHEVPPERVESTKAKSRNKARNVVKQALASEPVSEPEQGPAAKMTEPPPMVTSRWAGRQGLTKRQAAAARLPRHQRWKRRLHPASW